MKTKEYSYDSEGHIKYWYNRSRRFWEVFNFLSGTWVNMHCATKEDARNSAEWEYNHGKYGYTIPDNKPVTREDLSTWKMTIKNEKKFTKITRVDGKKFDWVGIGWIEAN